jgi:DNA-binding response OmpR family regulator
MASEKSALHVDDDPLILKLVRSILGHAGYDVVSANNIGEAMRALEAAPPSMILLDVEIGLESGYDLFSGVLTLTRRRRAHSPG